jgi:protein phosphatase
VEDFALVALIGVSGSGKSTFARKHFLPSEVLSSDGFRAMVSDDENDQAATNDAFDALHYLASIRLRRRKLTVVDATNVQAEARKSLLQIADCHNCLAVAIVLDVPERICHERNQTRPDRQFGNHVIRNQSRQLRQGLRNLRKEGFRYVFILNEAQIARTEFVRTPLWTDRRTEQAPFDLIGDVHGCYEELLELLAKLGYAPNENGVYAHPEGRRAVFLGDLVDRGPKIVETVRLVQAMMQAGTARCVPGNHDDKLKRALQGKPVKIAHGLDKSLEQIEALPDDERDAFKKQYIAFADSLISHLWLDGGKLCAAHAGMKEEFIGRASGRVREFALYGETTGETDEFGLPVRYQWAQDYRGTTAVIYGHTPVVEAEWLNNTLNLDTGCVFGGKLSALRYPEREIVQVPARQTYAESPRPIVMPEATEADAQAENGVSLQWQHDELLRVEDVIGKRIIQTRFGSQVIVPAPNAAAALEVMSRFAVDPRWLIYLPPTMSPCATADDGDLLERPDEAFAYFRESGVTEVVCQRKHMGSRAVVVLCRNADSARKHFGANETAQSPGRCYTRTGRQFFDDATVSQNFLDALGKAISDAGLWDELNTDWVCLDGELMPWNAKAQGLLREQYAPVGAAAKTALDQALASVEQAVRRGIPLETLQTRLTEQQSDIVRYTEAYARYCWDVRGLEDIRFAPFHIMASEGQTHWDKPHAWHIETLAKLAPHSPLLMATESRTVQTDDAESCAAGAAWWQELTDAGGEGMVVKPRDFIVRGERGMVQPAVKVRGREYLRIIYGPDYTRPEHLERLRKRGLAAKRSLAMREFNLGLEALARFVEREPLRRVHECVFGVLALESEPVDPRL